MAGWGGTSTMWQGQQSDPNTNTAEALAAAGLAPQMINQLMSSGLFGTQVGFGQAGMDLANRMAQQGYGNTQAEMGISRGALGRQQGALGQSQGLEKQLLGLSGQNLGISRERLGLQGRGLDLSEQVARYGNQRQLGNESSSATARGALNTQGHRQNIGDINQSLANQLAQIGMSREGMGMSGRELDLAQQRLGIQGQQSDLNQTMQSGSLADQLARLNLAGNQAGQSFQNQLQGNALNFGQNTLNQFQNTFGSNVSGALGIPGILGNRGAIAPQQPTINRTAQNYGGVL